MNSALRRSCPRSIPVASAIHRLPSPKFNQREIAYRCTIPALVLRKASSDHGFTMHNQVIVISLYASEGVRAGAI
jgi:hypothetical protein